MPFNGSGTFARVYNWVTDKNNSINVTASRMDTEDSGFATGLSLCLTKDGQQNPTANLPMNGFAHTGVANATLANQYGVVSQIQNSSYNWIAGGGTADAITATYAPAVTVLVDGIELDFRATAANATTTPTFSPNGLTAHTITKKGGSALATNDIPAALAECKVRYNLANTRWELINPAPPAGNAGTVTSVGVSTNASYLTIASTPVTSSGTITANKTTGLTQNQFVATPNGSSGAADLRAIVFADLPASATAQSTPANPTGTSSATSVMMGLAGTITPTASGKIFVVISGDLQQNGSSGIITVQISYGTSTAPVNGAALAGTQAGNKIAPNLAAESGQAYPFSVNAVITGLTPSTAYWLDLAVSNSNGNTSLLKNISISVFEK